MPLQLVENNAFFCGERENNSCGLYRRRSAARGHMIHNAQHTCVFLPRQRPPKKPRQTPSPTASSAACAPTRRRAPRAGRGRGDVASAWNLDRQRPPRFLFLVAPGTPNGAQICAHRSHCPAGPRGREAPQCRIRNHARLPSNVVGEQRGERPGAEQRGLCTERPASRPRRRHRFLFLRAQGATHRKHFCFPPRRRSSPSATPLKVRRVVQPLDTCGERGRHHLAIMKQSCTLSGQFLHHTLSVVLVPVTHAWWRRSCNKRTRAPQS